MKETEANGSGVVESTEEYQLSQPLGPPNENGDTKCTTSLPFLKLTAKFLMHGILHSVDISSIEVEECRAVESNANKLLAELTPVKSIRDLTL